MHHNYLQLSAHITILLSSVTHVICYQNYNPIYIVGLKIHWLYLMQYAAIPVPHYDFAT